MCRVERIRNLASHAYNLFFFKRFTADSLAQRLPFQQFHNDKGASAILVYVVHRADVWMVQGRRCPCFCVQLFQDSAVVS
jgi:hypothetical protein